MAIEELLDDLLHLILLKLPITSLLRFKTVSQHWHHLISQPSFSYQKYLINNATDRTDKSTSSFLVATCREKTKKDRYFTHLSISNTGNKLTSSIVECFRIPNIITRKRSPLLIYPAGFGIYCLIEMTHFPKEVSMWNPTTREVKILPNMTSKKQIFFDYGFAHVEYINGNFSYKVGLMRHKYDESAGVYDVYIDVYSSTENLWKQATHSCRLDVSDWDWDSYRIGLKHCGGNLNGKFHFLAWFSKKDPHIVTFDMHTEEFERLEIPCQVRNDSKFVVSYSLLTIVDEKSLCLLSYRGEFGEQPCVDTWVMHEYGNAESWTKISTVGPISDFNFVDILGVNNHVGGLFFQTTFYGDGLFLCRYGSEKADILLPTMSHDLEKSVMVEYKESIVSLDGMPEKRIKRRHFPES